MPTAATHTFLDAIRHLPVGGALSIPDVPWADYEALLTELGDGYAVRVIPSIHHPMSLLKWACRTVPWRSCVSGRSWAFPKCGAMTAIAS